MFDAAKDLSNALNGVLNLMDKDKKDAQLKKMLTDAENALLALQASLNQPPTLSKEVNCEDFLH